MSELYLPSRLVDELAAERELTRNQHLDGEAIVFQDTQLRIGGLAGSTGRAFSQTDLLKEIKGWVAIGLRAVTDRLSSLTLGAHVLVDDDENPRLPNNHPANQIVTNPNPVFSMPVMLGLMGAWLKITGNAYFQVLHDGIGVPRELWPMPPDRVFPVPSTTEVISGYIVLGPNGEEIPLSNDEVVRVWRPDASQIYQAQGDLAPQADEYNAERFRVEHVKSTFENDATPRVVMESAVGSVMPQPREQTAWQTKWRELNHRRLGARQGVPAILPVGFKLHEMGQKIAGEATAVLGDKARDQLLAAIGTPGSIVGLVMDVNRAAAETNQFTFDRNTVLPMTSVLSGALTQQLAPQFDARIVYEFAKFVADDKEFELTQEMADLDRKVITPNEVRKRRGREDEDWGHLPVGSFTDTPYTGEEDTGLESESDLRGSSRDITSVPRSVSDRAGLVTDVMREHFNLQNSWERVIKNERRFTSQFARGMGKVFKAQADLAVKRFKAKSRISAKDVFTTGEFNKLYSVEIQPLREKIYVSNGEAAFGVIEPAGKFTFAESQKRILDRIHANMVQQVDAHTKDLITRALTVGTSKGESVDQISKRIKSSVINRKRARTIARTEVGKAAQLGQLESFTQSAVVEGKQWNTSLDGDVRDSHIAAEAQIVPLDDEFVLGSGETAEVPLDPRLPAADIVNCRCFVTPVFIDDPEET